MACSTNYSCTPIWYTAEDNSEVETNGEFGTDVIFNPAGPHAVDNNVVCITKTGDIQIQLKDDEDEWFTPTEASWTVTASGSKRIPRANMPEMRIIATGDATFYVVGSITG